MQNAPLRPHLVAQVDITARSPGLKRATGSGSSVERMWVWTVPIQRGGPHSASDASAPAPRESAARESPGPVNSMAPVIHTVSGAMLPARQATRSARAATLEAQSCLSTGRAAESMTQVGSWACILTGQTAAPMIMMAPPPTRLRTSLRIERSRAPGVSSAAMAMASFTLLPLVVAALVAASACSQGGSAAGPVAAPHARQAPLDTLLVQIRSGPPELRRRAAGQLSTPGPRIQERMRALRGALGDPDRQVSTAAGWSLGEIGAPAIPVLSDALRDPDPAVRRRAAAAMGKVGLAARDAVKEAMTDPDKSVRNMAALVIAGMGPRASRGAG